MLHTVAKLYYLSNIPQNEIARQLGLSTATVSRLLKRAREDGIVRIEVRELVGPDELARDLERRLGLKQAVVADVPETNAVTSLAGAVSNCFADAGLHAGSVVAIGWGRAVRDIIQAGLPRIPGVITVPANGGMQETAEHFQINEFVRLAAEKMGGTPQFLHAPYLPSAGLREAFLADPSIRETIALWDRTEAALVGIGLPHISPTPGQLGVTADERQLTTAAGDVIRHYFDLNGELVTWSGADRLIALSVEQLRAIPSVIGVAVSSAKATAIVGAVRSRLVNILVTDVRTAQAVLDLCD
ncbi:MAG: sugar-binding domain-containing protein [Ancalomicrobiaceae bacterium]|nr:sugar-binding domain-containing protein [Ancalomicrobiaceae bacterium]